MSNFEEYMRQAEYCERMAKRADSIDSKASWLRLAGKWLTLAAAPKPAESNDAEKFDAIVECKNTGQEKSTSSH